jgi:uncharacterized protein YjeT (DUF2065 family)
MNQLRLFTGLVLVAIGVGFLFGLPVFRILIPTLIILLGIKLLLGQGGPSISAKSEGRDDKLSQVLIFSGIDRKIISDNFSGGEVVAIFGGGDVDLTQAKTTSKTLKLSLVAVFGGLKIRVPETWRVSTEGVGVLGAFENKARPKGKAKVNLKVDGVAIFGGVEIVS